MIAVVYTASAAFAWEQKPDANCTSGHVEAPIAPGMTYHFWDQDGDWGSILEATMEEAIDQWDGGAGLRNRGFTWNFVRGIDEWVNLTDDRTQIEDFSRAEFDAWGIADDAIAKVFRVYDTPTCNVTSFDVVLIDADEDSDTWTWTDNLPSWASAGDYISLPAVMVHEAGHGMSLDHVWDLAVMEEYDAAESGGALRLNEDEFVAMRSMKPDASTGKNFMLSKWVSDNPNNRQVREAWDSDPPPASGSWQVSAGGDLPVGVWNAEEVGPSPIAAIVNGTSASYASVPIHWMISSDSICFDQDDIFVGYQILDMSPDTPDLVAPSWGEYRIPSSTPTGVYWLCAGIDAYGTLSETDTSDNIIRSERLIEVVP